MVVVVAAMMSSRWRKGNNKGRYARRCGVEALGWVTNAAWTENMSLLIPGAQEPAAPGEALVV